MGKVGKMVAIALAFGALTLGAPTQKAAASLAQKSPTQINLAAPFWESWGQDESDPLAGVDRSNEASEASSDPSTWTNSVDCPATKVTSGDADKIVKKLTRKDEGSNGEEACENKGLEPSECTAVGCCKYDDGQCWSAVETAPCSSGSGGGGGGGARKGEGSGCKVEDPCDANDRKAGFECADKDSSGTVDKSEMEAMLEAEGAPKEAADMMMDMFDVNGDGTLSEKEVNDVTVCLMKGCASK